jgi:3'-5' exoribonuclease
MTLSELELAHGAPFCLTCRIRHPLRRIAANGSHYLCFNIEDYRHSLKANAWPNQCDLSVAVHDLDRVTVEGKLRAFNDGIMAVVTSIRPLTNDLVNAVELIPRSMCPAPSLLPRLADLSRKMANWDLTQFISCVFADDTFALPFVRLPASRSHHHSVAGGLLGHSLECAEMVQRFTEFSQDMTDLAVAAALLHDAGKVVTLRTPDKFCIEGAVLDHNALTLEVLAPHLKRLDAVNQEVATALRYLWTWQRHRRGQSHPVVTIAEAVAAADRISSGLSIEEMVFRERPNWQTIVRNESHGGIVWRPNLSCSEDDSDILDESPVWAP